MSDQKGTEKAATLSMGGRRPGGLTPRSPAEGKRQAIPPTPAPGLTLQAGENGSPAAGKLAVAFAKLSWPQGFVIWQAAAGPVDVIWPQSFLFRNGFAAGTSRVPSARRVGPSIRAWRGGNAVLLGWSPEDKFLWPSSTDSERWHLSCLLLSVTKEVRPTAASRSRSFLVAQKGT